MWLGSARGKQIVSPYAAILAIATIVGMTTGQVLFKLASARGVEQILISSHFWIACCLYAVVTVVWVLLLREMDLTRAYPIMAACYVFVPIVSAIFLGERVGPFYVAGVVLIIGGIVLTAHE
jgi:drug/metabolite transporter (DMT)-like permease